MNYKQLYDDLDDMEAELLSKLSAAKQGRNNQGMISLMHV